MSGGLKTALAVATVAVFAPALVRWWAAIVSDPWVAPLLIAMMLDLILGGIVAIIQLDYRILPHVYVPKEVVAVCESVEPLYSVGTWDMDRQAYTPQRGLSVPSFNITLRQLIVAVRELRRMGYSAHRVRDADGSYDDNDWCVLIERTDGRCWKEIRRAWNR